MTKFLKIENLKQRKMASNISCNPSHWHSKCLSPPSEPCWSHNGYKVKIPSTAHCPSAILSPSTSLSLHLPAHLLLNQHSFPEYSTLSKHAFALQCPNYFSFIHSLPSSTPRLLSTFLVTPSLNITILVKLP